MKIIVFGVIFVVLGIVVFQINSLFKVDNELNLKYAKSKNHISKRTKAGILKVAQSGDQIKGQVDSQKNRVRNKIDKKLIESERAEVIKFSKKYFGQVGRNYRIYYLKDDRMVYLHRMWFDQIRKPSSVIRSDFPSIFSDDGCCFAAEPDFFIVIPGTKIFKQIGHYRFKR